MLDSLIASSSSTMPSPRLQGYAQIAGDLVFGESGRAEYGDVAPGHDGAYVTVTAEGEGEATVGTDDAGYGRLFLYQRGHRWALGTSLMELADYVSSQNWPLDIDEVQLKGFLLTSKGMLGQQLLSLDTVFREIRLLAPAEEVHLIMGNGPEFMVRQRQTPKPFSYQEALEEALNEMVGRLRSLLQAGVPVASDITGGRDSRTVLAALRRANTLDGDIGEKVRFRSNRRHARDWTVAKHLSETYGLYINRSSVGSYSVDPAHSYHVWRTNDLGVYSPLYPFLSYTPELTLSGAAGGVHRSVYREASLHDRLRRMKTEIVSREEIEVLTNRMEQTLDHVGGHSDRRLEHFRQFRNRLHGGRVPLRTHNVAPLASRRLKVASGLVSDEHLSRAQFYADIMLNLDPALAAEPYDTPHKGWGDQHYRELTRVEVAPDAYSGSVYGEMAHAPGMEVKSERPLQPFVDEFHAAVPAAKESGLLSREYIDDAEKTLQDTQGIEFQHAIMGTGVSVVILVGQATMLSSAG